MTNSVPHALQSEQAVLGEILTFPERLPKIRDAVCAADFHNEAHAIIFDVMGALADRGIAPDLIATASALQGLQRTENLTIKHGDAYLPKLMEMATSVGDVLHHARLVKEKALCRGVIARAARVQEMAEQGDIDLLRAERDTLDIAGMISVHNSPSGLQALCMADVLPLRTEWFWPGYLPLGMVSLVVGDGGLGKGTLSIDLTARLSRGCPFPLNEQARTPGNTLLVVSAEDDLHRMVVPRLLAANADLQHVFTPPEDALITLPESVAGLEALIVAHKVQFLVIDPLNAYLSDKLNAYKDTDIRQALTPLKHMAERQRVAVMIVHHINRSVSTQASQRVSGSSGIRNAARPVLRRGRSER